MVVAAFHFAVMDVRFLIAFFNQDFDEVQGVVDGIDDTVVVPVVWFVVGAGLKPEAEAGPDFILGDVLMEDAVGVGVVADVLGVPPPQCPAEHPGGPEQVRVIPHNIDGRKAAEGEAPEGDMFGGGFCPVIFSHKKEQFRSDEFCVAPRFAAPVFVVGVSGHSIFLHTFTGMNADNDEGGCFFLQKKAVKGLRQIHSLHVLSIIEKNKGEAVCPAGVVIWRQVNIYLKRVVEEFGREAAEAMNGDAVGPVL